LSFLPGRATFYKPGSQSYIYNRDQDEINKYGRTYISEDTPFFSQVTLNQIDIFVDGGFYHSEGTHIWSQKESTIIVKNSGQVLHLVISTYPDSNHLNITMDDNVYTYDLTAGEPRSVQIDLRKIQGNWLKIEFAAEASLRPTQRNRHSFDNRNLSFGVSIYQDER
jgi:hypothetical protein